MSRIADDKIDPWGAYVILGKDLLFLRKLEKDLYSEKRMSGDDMRDYANYLNQCMNPIKIEE